MISPGDRYVALGSSFAAGPGLRPRAAGSPRLSGRSSVNYAHLLATRLHLDLCDVTYSGATTADLLGAATKGRPAQVDALSPTTALVTVTAGGNDVGYLPTLTLSSVPWPVRRLRRVKRKIEVAADAADLASRFTTLRDDLRAVVREYQKRAPAARVVLVDYLTILPPASDGRLGPLDAETVDRGRDCATRLSDVMRHVAAETGCGFLPMSTASSEHHAWSAEPWTRRFHLTLPDGAAYHPNAAGMRAVADRLAVFLTDEPERTS